MNIIDKIKKSILWHLTFRNLGFDKSVWIDQRGLIIQGDRLSIGKDVYIGPNATFLCTYSDIVISSHVVIGPGLTIVENNHVYNKVGTYIKNSGLDNNCENKITIEEDCWIGANVTILKGVTIGRGAIVAACACVTRDVEPYTIVGGVPAKVIKKRYTDEEIKEHEFLLYGKE